MLIIKDDTIDLRAIHPALVLVLCGAVVPVLADAGVDCVITSCGEYSAKHNFSSLHYAFAAVDIRKTSAMKNKLFKKIRSLLNQDFDLVNEHNHWHLEFQPKRRIFP